MWLEENLIGYFTLCEINFPLILLDFSLVKLYFRPIAFTICLSIKLWNTPVLKSEKVRNL